MGLEPGVKTLNPTPTASFPKHLQLMGLPSPNKEDNTLHCEHVSEMQPTGQEQTEARQGSDL